MVLNEESVAPFRQEQMNQETQGFVNKLVQQAQENVDQYVEAQNIFIDVRDQLVDTGRVSEQSANVMAQLVPAWATVFANRNNTTVKDAFERTGLLIQGPETGKLDDLDNQSKLLQQDFGDIQLTQEVQVEETGETVRLQEPAQRVHDQISKRRNVVEKVQRCLGGN